MDTEELRAAFRALRGKFNGVPPDYTWERNAYELAEHVGRDDPERFLRWSTVEATMFVGSAKYIEVELKALRTAWDARRWQLAIEEPWFGDAIPLAFYPRSSGNLVHQAYHLKNWEDATGLGVKDLGTIFEFGGGYGAMALVARRLGFKGRYVIQDIEEVSLLQRYWLSNVGINDVECLTDHPGRIEADLLIACFSMSEIPMGDRRPLEDGEFGSYLIAYQNGFAGVDNIEYFRAFAGSFPNHSWAGWRIDHLNECHYLFGVSRPIPQAMASGD